MSREIIFLRQEFTTRRYAIIWVSIWLILIFATWFSRPLMPFQETLFSGIVFELYQSDSWLYPRINEVYQHSSFPLNYWLALGVWDVFGVSEFSLRVLASFFSLGTLFLTAWAAYQLWPDKRDVRANAPLILIGSLMWTIFATANVEYVFFTFYLMLTMNFLIRVWRFNQNIWWVGFAISLTLGLFSSGLIFFVVTVPIIFLSPYWASKKWKSIYIYGVISSSIALIAFCIWAVFSAEALGFSVVDALGLRTIVRALSHAPPFYVYFLNLVVISFPWLFWLRIYRLFRCSDRDESLIFVMIWFVLLIAILGILSLTSLDALLPLYPAFGLIIARIYRQGVSRKRDVLLITIVMVAMGLLMILLPLNYAYLSLPDWVGAVSPFWGAGLILFSFTLLFNAENTRIMTLALMSVAMTLAINFGVVRVASDFYDLAPAGERVSWYQTNGFTVGHASNYRGHLHFVGGLKAPLVEVGTYREMTRLVDADENARVILYLEDYQDLERLPIEYWQPFRGKYLVIIKGQALLDIYRDRPSLLFSENPL